LNLYIDSSALVKAFLQEPSATEARRALDDAEVQATNRVAYAEVQAAFERARREDRLTDQGYRKARADFRGQWQSLYIVEVDQELVETASELMRRHPLRALDSIHLASALAFGRDASFACWDTRLWDSARAAGFRMIPEAVG
jgi:hypothetical protein